MKMSHTMKKLILLSLALCMAAVPLVAGQKLTLKDITGGQFRGESMAAVKPLSDGETYAQLSSDGQRIEQYSFKNGKLVGNLLDLATAHGAKVERV